MHLGRKPHSASTAHAAAPVGGETAKAATWDADSRKMRCRRCFSRRVAGCGLVTASSRRHATTMIRLKPIPTDLTVLDQSHLFRGARLILGYIVEHGPIPLTPSKAFKRVFVNWAAEAFVWPHWTVDDLYRVNKVLNEYDFARSSTYRRRNGQGRYSRQEPPHP